MTLRRLEILQWVGLIFGALVWTGHHVLGYGLTEAACSRAGSEWGISLDAWETAAMAAAAAGVIVSELAALTVVLRTREESYEGPPPPGRIRFLAIAAVVANLIFLTIIVLDGLGSIVNVACRQG
jgi:uncharacterized membrane protein YeiB